MKFGSKYIKLSFLLFLSGMCALIYQMVWMREFRLIFGATTQASATVLALFMGGIGFGSIVLGKRADKTKNPLAMYGILELVIALYTCITPFIIAAIRVYYWLLGGTVTLGPGTAMIVRIFLSGIILIVPTFLMGGTLPAVACFLQDDSDVRRRGLALLYSVNTLGAVFGAWIATFFLLPQFGGKTSIWSAVVINLIVSIIALLWSRGKKVKVDPKTNKKKKSSKSLEPDDSKVANPVYIYLAAAIVGFVFFIMELVWYRMLGPILGGSTYTFGLILMMTLSGIGIGGAIYSVYGSDTLKGTGRRLTIMTFALTCSIEALFFIIPYALGDRIAVLTTYITPLTTTGIWGKMAGWSFISGLVILPGAIISGFQFPLLIGLLGKGCKQIGSHTGRIYFWNTIGSISGSLAGGFFMIPMFSAPGCWVIAVITLCLLSAFSIVLHIFDSREWKKFFVTVAIIVLCVFLSFLSRGPTAVWRHSSIAFKQNKKNDSNEIRRWFNAERLSTIWEADGLECSVALQDTFNGFAFIVNGKSDGSSRGDAGTQVMLGLVSAIIHPDPKNTLLIGLGTGSSAGWLADVKSMELVDVAEIEPLIKRVAEYCVPVNRNVLKNPKANVIYADGREVLFSSKKKYDLIVSEPSNPYRPGVATLFTSEFYRAVKSKLARGGIFSQWMQYYSVEQNTVRIVYSTLCKEFPFVETWQTKTNDLLLVCSMQPIKYSVPQLREKIKEKTFSEALNNVWRATDIEGLLAHYVANNDFSRSIAKQAKGVTNTDDHTIIEYQFANSIGINRKYTIKGLRDAARKLKKDKPVFSDGFIDDSKLMNRRIEMYSMNGRRPGSLHLSSQKQLIRTRTLFNFTNRKFRNVIISWKKLGENPETPFELLMLAQSYAEEGDLKALKYAEKLEKYQPVEADITRAILFNRRAEFEKAVSKLKTVFSSLQRDPWPNSRLIKRSLLLAMEIASKKKCYAKILFDALKTPFSVRILQKPRRNTLLFIAEKIDAEHVRQIVSPLEPNIPWEKNYLLFRKKAYQKLNDPRIKLAEEQYNEFVENLEPGIVDDLTRKTTKQ